MGRRAVGLEAGEARVGGLRDREVRAAVPQDAAGLSQPGTKHLPVSRFRSRVKGGRPHAHASTPTLTAAH